MKRTAARSSRRRRVAGAGAFPFAFNETRLPWNTQGQWEIVAEPSMKYVKYSAWRRRFTGS